jgi:uncharacterized protein
VSENKTKIFSNIIIALILSFSIIISCFIGVYGLAEYKRKKYDIDIKGYTTQQITSDLIVWSGIYDVDADNLKDGYNLLEKDKEKVKKYLVDNGIMEEDLIFSSISISENYVVNQNGIITNEISNYTFTQTVTISSGEIEKVTEISRDATELINEGVQLESYAPEYHYTKLEDLKVSMLADATKDATKRAGLIAENAGGKLGGLTHATVSSIKITPLYSVPDDYYNDSYYYGYGNHVDNATVSLEKEVTVSVYCTFEIK